MDFGECKSNNVNQALMGFGVGSIFNKMAKSILSYLSILKLIFPILASIFGLMGFGVQSLFTKIGLSLFYWTPLLLHFCFFFFPSFFYFQRSQDLNLMRYILKGSQLNIIFILYFNLKYNINLYTKYFTEILNELERLFLLLIKFYYNYKILC